MDGPIADLNNPTTTHKPDDDLENEPDNNSDYNPDHEETENLTNTQYAHTQSNLQETVSGITYSNKNRVNPSGRSKLQEKFYRMSAALCEVVDDYGLVSFHPMNIEDVEVRYCECR